MRKAYGISLLAAAVGSGAQIVLPWTTDFSKDSDGHDGPWQAPIVSINNKETPLWPGGSDATDLLTKDLGGAYEPSKEAVRTGSKRGDADAWMSSIFLGGGPFGFEYYDEIKIGTTFPSEKNYTVNATIIAATEWDTQGNTTISNPTIGLLGLAPGDSSSDDNPLGGILDQLKKAKATEKSAFSVHMGSAALGIPGSLVLGGYEQNRALGQVGKFTMQDRIPLVFLRDVVMGVEVGEPSPFPANSNGSFWVEPTEIGAQIIKDVGGPDGSIVALPNPASPYIYLQPGMCEKIGDNLGLTLHAGTGLYLWESKRPGSVKDFINSPAYLGFVFSDKTATTNLTIKVPFMLLNLTLQPPLVETAVNYFPCKSINSSYGLWQLGRAFLQASFIAVDYDEEAFYLAQAPGPYLEQSVVQTFGDSGIKAAPIDLFQSSWNGSWTVNGGSRHTGSQENSSKSGTIAGTVVGTVARAVIRVVFVVMAGLWL